MPSSQTRPILIVNCKLSDGSKLISFEWLSKITTVAEKEILPESDRLLV